MDMMELPEKFSTVSAELQALAQQLIEFLATLDPECYGPEYDHVEDDPFYPLFTGAPELAAWAGEQGRRLQAENFKDPPEGGADDSG